MKKFAIALVALALSACASVEKPLGVAQNPSLVTEAEMREFMAPLASDEFEGRMPGTVGETKTLAYLIEQLHELGVEGASGGEHPYLQPFKLTTKQPIDEAKAEKLMASPGPPRGQPTFMLNATKLGTVITHNVVGRIPGRNPDGKVVLLMGHWDHLGICRPEGEADRICNGAVDNASGIAAILAVARRAKAMGLDRDLWIVLTSAEEWGLFGAYAFAENPPLDLKSIVAAFNLDTIGVAPAGMPVAMVAEENSPLEAMVIETATSLGRMWDGDDEANGFINRQDGAALYEKGVPVIMAGGAFSDMEKLQAFLGSKYHAPDDELDDDIELGGAVDDANLHVLLVRRAASREFNPARN